MIYRTVATASAWQWLADAVRLLLKNPGPFVLMALICTIVGLLPGIGKVILLAFGPAMMGGMIFAVREEDVGDRADFQHLFQAFRNADKLGAMLLLCLPGAAAGVLLIAMSAMLLGGAMIGAGLEALGASEWGLATGLGGGFLLFMTFAGVFAVAVFALTFFALPRVMLADAEPFAAMKDSAYAFIANPTAMLVFLALLFISASLTLWILSLASTTLAVLVFGLAIYPIFGAASYFACKDVFGAGGMPTPPPPANFDD